MPATARKRLRPSIEVVLVHRLFALLQLKDQFVDPLDGQRIKALRELPVALNSDIELLALVAHKLTHARSGGSTRTLCHR